VTKRASKPAAPKRRTKQTPGGPRGTRNSRVYDVIDAICARIAKGAPQIEAAAAEGTTQRALVSRARESDEIRDKLDIALGLGAAVHREQLEKLIANGGSGASTKLKMMQCLYHGTYGETQKIEATITQTPATTEQLHRALELRAKVEQLEAETGG
jgi:hypothetical protein